jgi:hypothetical protein
MHCDLAQPAKVSKMPVRTLSQGWDEAGPGPFGRPKIDQVNFFGNSTVKRKWNKSTLAVPGKMYVLSGSTVNCNIAKPYLTLTYKSPLPY